MSSSGAGVHQFVPMLHRHDAVGEHARTLRRLLVESGVPSRIYVEVEDPDTADETLPYLAYGSEAVEGDVLVYQFATRSAIAGWLTSRSETLVLNYHSITPPEFFGPWNDMITRLQVGARLELAALAPRAALGVAISEFDAAELRAAGCERVEVVSVVNLRVPPLEPAPGLVDEVRDARRGGGARWLSVGRLAPNKAHERTIAALFVTRATADPGATLNLVGSPTEPSYARALVHYARELGLAGFVDFVSGIDDEHLAAQYRAADVLVMLSQHEGFGVPLVEAMGQGLPIVTADVGAVREVVGDAAVLLDSTAPRRVASVVAELVNDREERARRAAAGRAAFDRLDLAGARKRLVDLLRDLGPTAAAANEPAARPGATLRQLGSPAK